MAKKKKESNKSSVEKDFADLFQHIQDQNFGSIEELQEFLDQTAGKRIDEIIPKKKGKLSNKELAQELLFEAYNSTPKKGRKLVDEAITLDPTNADAYVYLAESEANLDKAIKYYLKGIEAGKKAIGKKDFNELKGHFWGFHKTRPFMRAKAGLASCLYLDNQADEAVKHYKEMLELNPNDNQGIRYQLAICLVGEDKQKEYLELYNQFKDDASALWEYTYALNLFKQYGKSLKSNRALKSAYNANQFVTQFLAGEKPLPDYLPQFMGFGDENEAIYCLNDSGKIWMETEGALEWINEFYQKQKKLN